MARSRRARAVLAVLATTTTLLSTTACLSDEPAPAGPNCDTSQPANLYQNPVTITWWHNYNVDAVDPNDPGGKEYWQKVADDFEALHPTVTVDVQPFETNDLQRTRIPAALRTNDPPDLFQAWGGGEIADQVSQNQVKDITGQVAAEKANIGGATSIWAVNGCQYGLPFRMGIEGFWYNKAMFAEAGITATPTTLAELNDAVIKLKAIGVIPIAVGAGDGWPAAHYWYQFAIHTCSSSVLTAARLDKNFDDPCFVKAGQDLAAFVATEPFQPDFLGSRFGEGPNASASLMGNGLAAMELMGDWDKGTMEGLSPDGKGIGEDLGWFPMVDTGGNPEQATVALGGGDGFACSANAPPECVELLKYIVSPEVQLGYAALGVGLPVAKGAESALSDPVLRSILQGTQQASSVELWLDTQYGSAIGDAMNAAIVKIFDGSGSPEDVVTAIKTAAAR